MTLQTRQDRRYIRPGYRSNRYLLVEITAPASRRESTREPLDAAFVLDRSGSMAGSKIALARQAIDAAIASLTHGDRFAIVAYDNQVDVVWPSSPVSASSRSGASRALATVDARGSTNLFEGWMTGCAQVAANQGGPAGMHRVLLMSDGLANQGVTDREELVRHAGELWRRGVATWTFGFGADFDEDLMDRLAVAGGGQSYYVESPLQIRDFITSAVGEALDVVSRDVELRIEAPEGVLVEPLSLFRSHRNVDGSTVVEVGDLVSEQTLRLVVKVNFPYGSEGRDVTLRLSVADREGAIVAEPQLVAFRYADSRTNNEQPRDREVDREVASLYAARARQEAAAANRHRDYEAANRALAGVARRIRGYAGDDRQLRDLVAALEQEQFRVSRPMAAPDLKAMHYQSSYAMRDRDVEGKARKGMRMAPPQGPQGNRPPDPR
jgi:Ca-activated chloride channel family protein